MSKPSNYDFDPNNIAETMLQAELRARHAEDWAESRVAIANNRAANAMIVSLLALFIAGAATTALISSAQQQPSPTQINVKQPN